MTGMQTLGERIQILRKERKLTLEACAGEQLTKGMLSLIENNKANPSMENLTYLAKRLGVDVAELWENVSSQELQLLVQEGERFINGDFDEEIIPWLEKMETYLPKLTKGYVAARLLELYSKLTYYKKRVGWQETAAAATSIYETLTITARIAAMALFRVFVLFSKHKYQEALQLLLDERLLIEKKAGFMDSLTRLDLDYYEAVMRFAAGDAAGAIQVMDEAIRYSKKEQVFYRIEPLYRLAAFQSLSDGDFEELSYYEKKLIQYGEFAEENDSIQFAKVFRIQKMTMFEKRYEQALLEVDALLKEDMYEIVRNIVNLERGKALYGLNRYTEAAEVLATVVIDSVLHHPFDLSVLYVKEAYLGLCELEFGHRAEAKRLIETAHENMEQMPDTPFKQFVIDARKKIN
jgi:transcriptional regulator with XRE-family HTH domain